MLLGPRIESTFGYLRALIENAAASKSGLVFLLHPAHAPFLFKVVGRPDEGLRISEETFFCDWFMGAQGLIRTLAVDRDEVVRYRQKLLTRLQPLKRVRITTPAGTDLMLSPRGWLSTLGEIFTAPVEERSHGKVVIDACVYSGPPRRAISLTINAGRVTNLDDLDRSDPQQAMLYKDLTHDANACVLAELGIGINPGALWDQDVMESEQARGTCHVGFGNNGPYGGENASVVHMDLVMNDPHIEAC